MGYYFENQVCFLNSCFLYAGHNCIQKNDTCSTTNQLKLTNGKTRVYLKKAVYDCKCISVAKKTPRDREARRDGGMKPT